ncbi:hypothetical protein D3C76_908880 [compost metagenome]
MLGSPYTSGRVGQRYTGGDFVILAVFIEDLVRQSDYDPRRVIQWGRVDVTRQLDRVTSILLDAGVGLAGPVNAARSAVQPGQRFAVHRDVKVLRVVVQILGSG